jgi:tripartite-type tricarboxylate transporter receptor subunit TctC
MFKILTLANALLLGATLSAGTAIAQEYPKKQPIKIVVAFNAGGLTDVLARITAEFLQRRLGQAVIVENRAGASGAIGADYVAKAAPDGYTIYLSAPEIAVLPATRTNLPFKSEDFTYLIRPLTTVPLIVASPNLPVSSTKELITYMKANPGKVRYGTPGVGHLNHLGTAMFESAVGVKGTHIPYTGIAPIYTDLLAGNVDITTGATPPFSDQLKVLGPAGIKRHAVFTTLPTLEELGYKNAGHEVWFGFVAPGKLPKTIADRLIAELDAVYKDPEMIAKLQSAAKIMPEVNPLTGDAFKNQVLKENKNWKLVVEREKIVVQQ